MSILERIYGYFRRDGDRVKEISYTYTDNLNKILLETKHLKHVLSAPQMTVNDMFPTPYDSFEQKYGKFFNLVYKWTPRSEVWPLRYSFHALTACNTLSAAYVTNAFRRAFKLADNKTALYNSYLPSLVVSAIIGSLSHYILITLPIFSGEEKCEVCESTTASLVQIATSVIYPAIYSSITTMYFAYYFNTIPIPDDIKHISSRRYLLQLLKKAVQRNRLSFTLLGVSNALFAYFLTNEERKTTQFMYFKLLFDEIDKSKNKVKNA